MIQVRHLTKVYGTSRAVDALSLDVEEGSLLVLLGRSGSGKTTTLRMINRLIEPTAGDILVDAQGVVLPSSFLRSQRRPARAELMIVARIEGPR